MRNASHLSLAVCLVAAACGGEPAAPQGKPAAPEQKPAAPEPKPEPPKAEPSKPQAPAPDAPKPGALTPAPEPAPAERATKDAMGHDWATHMGDVAFTFDAAAAAKRAEEKGRAMMLFFTSPS